MMLKVYDYETKELITEFKVRKNANSKTKMNIVKNYFIEKYDLTKIYLVVEGTVSALYGNDLHHVILSDKINKSIIIEGL